MSRRKFDEVKAVSGAVQFLEKQVTSADPDVRRVGLQSVQNLSVNPSEFVDLNEKLIDNENFYTRRASADMVALSVLVGGGTVATDSLARFLADEEDPEQRRCAARSLVAIARQPVKVLPEAALGEVAPEPTAKEIAVKDNLSQVAAKEIAKLLSHENARVRETTVEAFGELGKWGTAHGEELAGCLADEDVLVRHAVVVAVEKLGAHVSESARHFAENFNNDSRGVREATRCTLLALGKSDGAAAATGAASMLRSPIVESRRAAAQTLLELGRPSAAHCEEIALLLEDKDIGMRTICARVLVAAGKKVKACLKAIIKRMEHPDADISRAAVDCMRALAPMVEKVARSQGRLFVEDQVGVDAEVALQRKLRAIRVLGGAGKNAEPYLDEIVYNLESTDWRLRRETMQCMVDLGKHASGKGAKEVARRLLHHEPDVRRVAVQTLGSMGEHAGGFSHRVEDMLDTEEDGDVKEACLEAFERLKKSGALACSLPSSPLQASSKRMGI